MTVFDASTPMPKRGASIPPHGLHHLSFSYTSSISFSRVPQLKPMSRARAAFTPAVAGSIYRTLSQLIPRV